MKEWKLFLDDIRDVSYLEIKKDEKQLKKYEKEGWVICRDVPEALQEVSIRDGLPSFISFDHDLGIEKKGGVVIVKQTGFDFVKIMVELVLDGKRELPDNFDFQVHSDNPIGKQNIETYLNNFIKHQRSCK